MGRVCEWVVIYQSWLCSWNVSKHLKLSGKWNDVLLNIYSDNNINCVM